VRYADDFVVLCRTAEEAQAALQEIQCWVTEAGLTLHPTKTQIVDSREKSFAFLGYSFRGDMRFPRDKSHKKITRRIRELTPRKSGESLERTIERLNRALAGWFNYFPLGANIGETTTSSFITVEGEEVNHDRSYEQERLTSRPGGTGKADAAAF